MAAKCETSGVNGTSLIMIDTQWLEQSALICILRIVVFHSEIFFFCPFPLCVCVCVLEDELRRNNESWENILVSHY